MPYTYSDLVDRNTGTINAKALMGLAHQKARRRWEGQRYDTALQSALLELWPMAHSASACIVGAIATRKLPLAEQHARHIALRAYIDRHELSR